MKLFRHPRWWYLRRLKDPPTWLKVTTTLEDPNPHPLITIGLNHILLASSYRSAYTSGYNSLKPDWEVSWLLSLNAVHVVASWWRHQMETFSTLMAFCAGNSPVTGEFPAQWPVTRSFDVFFDLCLNKCWVNNREAGDLRCHCTHYVVTVMFYSNDKAITQLFQFGATSKPCITKNTTSHNLWTNTPGATFI